MRELPLSRARDSRGPAFNKEVSVMTNRAALQSPPRISHSLQTREISRSLYCRRPRIAGGTGYHVLADDKSMFRFNGSQKARLGDAVPFPEHDSEQRHA